ncbi:hypothetical protein MO973_19690 [Paenibacillus sp. TRM 82003]|nr:hypothetical protein [Paenibacillus sp. TRM 82003]
MNRKYWSVVDGLKFSQVLYGTKESVKEMAIGRGANRFTVSVKAVEANV